MSTRATIVDSERLSTVYTTFIQTKKKIDNIVENYNSKLKTLDDEEFQATLTGGEGESLKEVIKELTDVGSKLKELCACLAAGIDKKIEEMGSLAKGTGKAEDLVERARGLKRK